MIKLVAVGTILGCLTAVASAQQNEIIRVTVHASTGSAAGLLARPEPYFSEGGPVAKMYLPSGTNARTRDGRSIVGFEFTAWTEGDATRGQVFALVSATNASPDIDLRYRADLVRRSEFASYRLRPGESVPITEMQSLGLEPMVVEAQPLRDMLAQLEQLRDRLQTSIR